MYRSLWSVYGSLDKEAVYVSVGQSRSVYGSLQEVYSSIGSVGETTGSLGESTGSKQMC